MVYFLATCENAQWRLVFGTLVFKELIRVTDPNLYTHNKEKMLPHGIVEPCNVKDKAIFLTPVTKFKSRFSSSFN